MADEEDIRYEHLEISDMVPLRSGVSLHVFKLIQQMSVKSKVEEAPFQIALGPESFFPQIFARMAKSVSAWIRKSIRLWAYPTPGILRTTD